MARLEGLNRRGDRWYLRIVIPRELQGAYGGKARVNLALGTADRGEALKLGHTVRGEWLATFHDRRRILDAQALPTVSPELAATLAARVRHRVLSGDDAIREDHGLLSALARASAPQDSPLAIPASPSGLHQQGGLRPTAVVRDPLQGATPEELQALAGLHGVMEGKAAIALAARDRRSVLPMVKAEALALGLAFDETAPGALEALTASLTAYRTAVRELTQRDAGEPIETPPAPAANSSSSANSPKTLRDVFDRWKASGDKPRSTDSLQSMGRALRQFEAQHPGLVLTAITRDMGDRYRSWLRENCGTPKTARDRLTAIKTLLRYAALTLEWLPRHPWMGLGLKATTTNKRRPWTDDELSALFGSPVFTRYALPDSKEAGRATPSGRDAAYWIPLLGLYSGARPGELCQLRVSDIAEVEGIPCMTITDEGDGQRVKTAAGHRTIPIHSELVRLGFLGYVTAMRDAGNTLLWPRLKVRADKPSDYFGRWFRELRQSVGLTDRLPDFYCFRHSVRPLMRRAGHPDSTIDKITGHESKGSVGTKVYDHWSLRELRGVVESIQHPAVRLAVVSPPQIAGVQFGRSGSRRIP
jgi:integrase